MPRRARGEGTVYKRPSRGYWEAQVRLGGRRYTVTARTRAEAVERLRELAARHQNGTLAPPSKLTLAQWAEEWLTRKGREWRPSTLRRARQALAPVVAVVGWQRWQRLQRLSPLHLSRCLDALRQGGLGTRTLALAYAHLHTCLEDAVKMGLLGSNPASRVPRPRHEPREAQDWSLDDMRRFLRTALEDSRPLAWMLALMLMTGLRPGEALGLRREDVDWDAEALRVRRSLTWAGSTWHIGRPKTRTGERAIALPALALDVLLRLPRGEGFAFWEERPPTTKQVSKVMGELCQRAGVPKRPAHYLRHCHASLLVHLGVDIKSAQRRLGHAAADMTLNVYAHHLPGQERAIAKALDQALDPGP